MVDAESSTSCGREPTRSPAPTATAPRTRSWLADPDSTAPPGRQPPQPPAPPAPAPRSGRPPPASSLINVVLPTPLTPTSAARAPSSRVRETPSNSGAPSWDFVRSVPLSMVVLSGDQACEAGADERARSATPPHARPEVGSGRIGKPGAVAGYFTCLVG